MSLKSAYPSRQSTPTVGRVQRVSSRSPLNSGRGSSCSTLSPRPVDSHAPSPLNLTLYGAPAPRSVHRSSKPQKPPPRPAPSPVDDHVPEAPRSPVGSKPPPSPSNGNVRSSPKSPSSTSNGSRSNSPKHMPSLVNGSQRSSPKHPPSPVNRSLSNSPKHPSNSMNGSQSNSPKSRSSTSNGSQSNSPKHMPSLLNGSQSGDLKHSSRLMNESQSDSPKHSSSPVNGSQRSSPKHSPSPVNGSQSDSPKHPSSPVNGSQSNSPKPASRHVNGSQSNSPKHPSNSMNGSQSNSPKHPPSPVNGSQSNSPKSASRPVDGSSPAPAPSRPDMNGLRLGTAAPSRYEKLPTPDTAQTPSSPRGVSTPRRSVSPLDLSSLIHDDEQVSPRVNDLSSRTESESINIDLAMRCNRCLSEASSLSGPMTGRSRDDVLTNGTASISIGDLNSSSYVTISDYSTQSCSSLPRDDVTAGKHSSDNASLCSDVSRQHSSDNASLRSDTPGRRRFILERLESGYYSPDTTDVRLSVAEVLEAADYAHRLASLLDLALGRELGLEHADCRTRQELGLEHADSRVSPRQELYEEEHTMKQFYDNVGRHPVFNSQNVERKVKYFESVEKLFEVAPPPPPPLPLQTVHDDTCFCCGPRVHFSPEDLLTQRSKLKKAPVKQFEVVGGERDLREILKEVMSRRRDGVMPREELVCGSVRSDWSDRGEEGRD